MANFPTTYIDAAGATQRLRNPSLPIKESVAFNVAIQTMESGTEQRRKKGAPLRKFELSYNGLDQHQYDAIKQFFFDCNGPATAFVWTHPGTKKSYRVRLDGDSLSGSYFGHNGKGPIMTLAFNLVQVA